MKPKPKQSLDDLECLGESSVLTSSREIFLYSHYDGSEEAGIDYRCANKFLMNLRYLESLNSDPVIVHQSTIGGDWNYGMMIYDAIKESACKFVFISHGICASMGTLIIQSVKDKGVRVTMPNCDWLIHEGTTGLSGTYKQLSSQYEYEKRILDKMYDVYTGVVGGKGSFFQDMTKPSIKKFLKRKFTSKEDWYLDAPESVAYGFADGVIGQKGFESIEKIVKDVS